MDYVPANGTIEVRVEDGVAWVLLNRPETRNTIDGAMQHDLSGLWPAINADDDVRLVVVAGKGDCFSDGLEVEPDPRASTARLDWLATYAHQGAADLAQDGIEPAVDAVGLYGTGLPDRTRGRPAKPLITAVHGACSGPALAFVYFADIVIAAEGAEFFDPRVNVGDAPLDETAGLTHFGSLPRLIALRLAYQGKNFKIPADRAYQLGMVAEVVPDGELMTRTRELAGQILEASPAAVRAVVAGYWDSENLAFGQARLLAGLFAQQARTIDGPEGHAAWVEGRAPVWPSLTTWSPPWPPYRLPAGN